MNQVKAFLEKNLLPKLLSMKKKKILFLLNTLNETFPKKDQAIVFDSIDDIPQIEYVIAIKLIPLKNIKYVSRISKNRFCIYFIDKNTVDQWRF